jgi:hypothetical protein
MINLFFLGITERNLSKLYYKKNLLEDAEIHAKIAVAILKKSFGNEHIEVADAIHNVGMIFIMQGKKSEGIAMLKNAVEIAEKTVLREHSRSILIKNDLLEAQSNI